MALKKKPKVAKAKATIVKAEKPDVPRAPVGARIVTCPKCQYQEAWLLNAIDIRCPNCGDLDTTAFKGK